MALKTGLGIGFGNHQIRILKGKRTSNGLLQILDAVELPSFSTNPENALANEIPLKEGRQILKQHKLSGSGLIGMTGRELILRYVDVPNVSAQRIRTMLLFEVEELSAKSGGDLATDFRLLSSQSLNLSPDQQIAMIALAKNSFLDQLFYGIRRFKFQPLGAVPNSINLFRSFIRHGNFESKETLLLIDIGKENIDLCFCKESRLLFARNLSGGGDLFTRSIAEQLQLPLEEAERLKIQQSSLLPGKAQNKVNQALRIGAGQLLSGIKSSISFAKLQTKMMNLQPDRIILAGGGAQQSGLEYLSQALNIKVEIFNPLEELDLSQCTASGVATLKQNPHEWASALGALESATDDLGFSLKLTPAAYQQKIKFLESTLFLYLTLLFTLSYLAVHLFATQKRNNELAILNKKLLNQRNQLEQRRNTSEQSQTNIAQYDGKLKLLQDHILPGTHFFKTISRLNTKIPPHIWIKTLSIKEDPEKQTKVIEMKGVIEETEKDVVEEFLRFTQLIEEEPDVLKCEPIQNFSIDPEFGRLLFTCWIRFKS